MFNSNHTKNSWLVVAKINPPEDLIVCSLLQSYGIPFKILRKEVPQLPVSIGPMALVEISVPENQAEQAKALLAMPGNQSLQE
ncbi:MAG: hypothetical protein ACOX6E_10760 [Syntrophomonadaceae bacterium]|jgi:hypothetical protein